MNIDIGPGREGDPTLYIDNYPVAEVFDVDRMNALIQRLERYETALNKITEEIIIESNEPAVLMGKAAIAINTMRKTAEEALKE
jgi:uncharacterized protein (DUF488 family)